MEAKKFSLDEKILNSPSSELHYGTVMICLVVRDITNTKSTSTEPPSFDKILQFFASYLEMKKKKKEKEAADLSGNSGIKKN